MTTFTIENEINQIIRGDSEYEDAAGAERFNSETTLTALAENWPMGKLIAIWNNLPGVRPVKKFTDRKTAITRIWTALNAAEVPAPPPVDSETENPATAATRQESEEAAQPEQQPMFAPEAAQAPDVAPAPVTSPKKATSKKKPRTAPTPAKSSPKASKTDAILALIQQPGGTTLNAIMEASGWQAHSVRGFISGTLGKKMGLIVISTKSEDGVRCYSLKL